MTNEMCMCMYTLFKCTPIFEHNVVYLIVSIIIYILKVARVQILIMCLIFFLTSHNLVPKLNMIPCLLCMHRCYFPNKLIALLLL